MTHINTRDAVSVVIPAIEDAAEREHFIHEVVTVVRDVASHPEATSCLFSDNEGGAVFVFVATQDVDEHTFTQAIERVTDRYTTGESVVWFAGRTNIAGPVQVNPYEVALDRDLDAEFGGEFE